MTYEQGYREQTEFLRDKTLAEMEQTLAAREGTVDNREPYNQGATDATRDLIRAMRVAEADETAT